MRRKRIGRGVNPKGNLRKQMFAYQAQVAISALEIELAGVEAAIDNVMFTVDRKDLEQRRSEILGELKKLRQ
jgi:hypothetical protein